MSAQVIALAARTGCKRPAPASVSFQPPLILRPTLRQVTCKQGNHYFKKVDGLWVCECGETRDKNGKPIKPPK